MKKYHYLIIGSGISGAVFAHEAAKRGRSCLVLERRGHTGGNLYCEAVSGVTVHKYGAHIFHTSDKKIWDYVNQFAEFNHFVNSPVAVFDGEVYNLPFNMNTFNKLWGVRTPAEAAAVINIQKKRITGEPRNLEEQAISMAGKDVYEILIKGYTEKQWGRPCTELPPEIIKRIPLRFTYDNNYFTDRYQGIPAGGYNKIIDSLLADADVLLNTDYHSDQQKYDGMAEKTVYTGMIDEYYKYRFGALEYRSLRFESAVLDKENHQGVAVVNYTDANVPYTRSIEHKHFEFGTQEKTVVTKEYPADWTPGAEAYYPVNDEKNRILYQKYRDLAENEERVIFCGRLAEYKYYDMDDAVAAALSVTEREFLQ
jgi:UDP-galactopyranose mutase